MSIKVMTLVFGCDLPPVDKLIALCLADHSHDDGTHVFPSVAALAQKASMGTTATRSALRRLEATGVLVQLTKGGGRGNPATYRFNLDLLVNPTQSVAFPNPTPEPPKPNAEPTETQRLNDETQRVGVAESLEPSVNLETSGNVIAPTVSSQSRDLIFEVLFALETGTNYSPEAATSLTKSARTSLNVAAAEIKATEIHPEELVQAIAAWPMLFDDATCTPHAVKMHLGKLRAAANGRTPRQERESEGDRMLRRMREAEVREEAQRA